MKKAGAERERKKVKTGWEERMRGGGGEGEEMNQNIGVWLVNEITRRIFPR